MLGMKINNSRVIWWTTLIADTLLAMLCMYVCHAWIPYCECSQLPTYVGAAALCQLLCTLCMPTEPLHPGTRFDLTLKRNALKALLIQMAMCTLLVMLNIGALQRVLLVSFCVLFFLLSAGVEHIGIRLLAKHNAIAISMQEGNAQLCKLLSTTGNIVPQAIFATTPDNVEESLYQPYSLQAVEEYLMADPHIETVFYVPCSNDGLESKALIQLCKQYHVQLALMPTFTMPSGIAIQSWHIDDSWLLQVRNMPLQETGNQCLKRSFDILLSMLFLLTLYPVIYLIICIITKIQSPGPVYEVQKRYDISGRKFKCYRFRCTPTFRFGQFMQRTGICHLPELFCVLKGDMSLVGPRPHTSEYNKLYCSVAEEYLLSSSAKPGMKGYGTNPEEKIRENIKQDIWYMQHWNLFLDICILLKRHTIR